MMAPPKRTQGSINDGKPKKSRISNGDLDIEGERYTENDEKYDRYNYQYATSTHGVENNMKPKEIILPKNKSDIQKVVKYAKQKGISVAVRTGGHQYGGASSTSGSNILLVLKYTFRDADKDLKVIGNVTGEDGKVYTQVYTSVCWDLQTFNRFLGEKNLFVPHGQCCNVHLGGHVQTGGYGQLGRSFGLMGDSVISLEIVNSNGELENISKDNNPKLFYAILGGSPGNFGVLTHFTINVYSDNDYKGSCGLKAVYLYTRKKLKALLNILAEMSEDEDLPRNYDYCVSMLSSEAKVRKYFDDPEKEDLDRYMKKHHPDLFGEDQNFPFWPQVIIVYAQWIKIKEDDTPDINWFYRIKNAGGLGFSSGIMRKDVSKLTQEWIFRDIREFDMPYNKRAYITNSNTLKKDGWVDWVTGRIEEIVSSNNGCKVCVQIQNYNGKHSRFFQNKDNGTSYSWRDSTVVCVLDCFYDVLKVPSAKNTADEWQQRNDIEGIGRNGKFSKQDRRVLWGSYGDFNMNNSWMYYYENEEKYDKLCEIKREADEDNIFTPNTFCVGGKAPPSDVLMRNVSFAQNVNDAEMSSKQNKEREELENKFFNNLAMLKKK